MSRGETSRPDRKGSISLTVLNASATAPPRAVGKIKGSALLQMVKVLRHYRAESEKVLPSRLHHYLNSKILVSQWYPDDEFLELLGAFKEVVPPRPGDFWVVAGADGAEANFGGVYAALVRPGDPAKTLQRYPAIWRMHHDSGRAVVRFPGERRAELEILHHLVEDERFCRLESGHVAKILQLAGAQDVNVDYREVATPRRPAIWDVSWR